MQSISYDTLQNLKEAIHERTVKEKDQIEAYRQSKMTQNKMDDNLTAIQSRKSQGLQAQEDFRVKEKFKTKEFRRRP